MIRPPPRRRQSGFSLVELMVSITISLIVVATLSAMLLNLSSTNREMAKANSQIENGRFAIQVLESDLIHAGFWGAYGPQFDDTGWPSVPYDAPILVPDPCLAYSATNWTTAYRNELIGIPVQSSDAAPGSCVLADRKANTDVLVVRHADTCVPGEAGCAADTAGKLYLQTSQCSTGTRGTAQATGNSSTTIALNGGVITSRANNAYSGMPIRIVSGTGAGQTRVIDTYNGTTFVATVTAPWGTTPDGTSIYTIVESILDTAAFSLHKKGPDCAAAAAADKRKFVSNIYYIRDYASAAGDGIPTLVRSAFDPAGPAALAHQDAEALVEGVERFTVELGIDSTVTRCALNSAVDYGVVVDKVNPATCAAGADPAQNTLPTNRGDGNPDGFVRCTTAAPCSAATLSNAVAARLYTLVRSADTSPGYTDGKTYCLGPSGVDGVCPAANKVGPFNDGYKRHLFSTTVRLVNVSARRETP